MGLFIMIICILVVGPILYLLAPSDIQLGSRTISKYDTDDIDYGSGSDNLAFESKIKALYPNSHEEMLAFFKAKREVSR